MAFPSNCEGRLINVDASTGCTLTRASIRGMTPQDFEDQGMKEVGMDKVYANLREARICGYRENFLQALLLSRTGSVKAQVNRTNIGGSESVILPYISRRQKRNINSNYWKITAGAPNAQAGKGDLPASAIDLTVVNNPSKYGTTLLELHRYFLPGKYLFVEYANATTGAAYSLQYKIVGAATIGGSTKVTVVPNYSEEGWNKLTAAEKLPFQIGGASGGAAVAGTTAFLGVNSVSDYESWGGQDVVENPNSFLHWFLQTSRIVHEYTDEFLRGMNAALTSNYFKQFLMMPMAVQKRIMQAKFDRDMLNSAFYGQRINEFQNVETYNKLETVQDPNQPGCVLEYKANALGFFTQLRDCNRVLDHQGNKLNLDSLFAMLYDVKRAREADGTQVEVIDLMTDRFTAGGIHDIMIAFYKKKYGVEITRYYQPNQALTFDNQVQINYNVYQLPAEYGGFKFAVFHHPYFDDRLAASENANRARVIWAIDWSDMELGIAGTNSKVRQTNEADALYNYVMKVNVKHVTMNSITWTAILEDPSRHYIVSNFSPDCPDLTVSGCALPAE